MTDPTARYPNEGFEQPTTDQPGLTDEMRLTPDHGEASYIGTGRLAGRRALITGGDSGIGRAVAIAFAREGAEVAFTYMPEERRDADETSDWVRQAGHTAIALPADLRDEHTNTEIVRQVVGALGGLDLLVLNAAYQRHRPSLSFSTEEFDRVMVTNLYAPFWMLREAIEVLPPGGAVIVTSSIQASQPSADLIDYAMTKAAQVAFVKAAAERLAPMGIRVNAVAPGPIWTPLIPATGSPDKLEGFGSDTPLGRPGQPAEVAPAFVYLASNDASFVSGAVLPVTGGRPF